MASSLPPPPTNHLVSALLTDLYQITMVYAHWKNQRHQDPAIFELFFRKNPFGGEYTIFAGLDECLKFIQHFSFSSSDIQYLQSLDSFQHADPAFFQWLASLDSSQVTVYAMLDGTICFPRVPLLMIEAPLAVGQLLETTLLTLVNYPSLIATNASRMVLAANDRMQGSVTTTTTSSSSSLPSRQTKDTLPHQCYAQPSCVEFGLRRAQGPDGGFSASKYCIVGGFVGTSNVQAGKLLGLNLVGTHAHAFVQAYASLEEVKGQGILDRTNSSSSTTHVELLPLVLKHRARCALQNPYFSTTNEGELAAFIAYAIAFPDTFLCLIDTYETLTSGLLNFITVALALDDLGYQAKGIRLDSGDLAYLSFEVAKVFEEFATERPFFSELSIVASNDINEDVLHALNKQKHAITVYGIGTNLVTCQKQPALGCVYKLVEIAGKPRMKLSQDIAKVLIPGRKRPFRLYGKNGSPILDVLVGHSEPDPVPGERLLCRHPFIEQKRAAVTPSRIEPLHHLVFDNGKVVDCNRDLFQAREAVKEHLQLIRPDILRYINPTPYKVSVTEEVFTFLHELWQSETPVAELS